MSNAPCAGTATSQMMIWGSRLSTFPCISIQVIGAELEIEKQGGKDRDEDRRGQGTRTYTVQASTLITIHLQNSNRYPGYMAKLSIIPQGENSRRW